ncbi:MAG: aminotransferase class I/II-fold pyridoxal phosphate-dependent enzyme, partial [Moorella sp. (in: Bacteria)]|nr:aminotransferase class I/II-fold pyridoxal phosphate-dependent enzyme [Moorella sp. (in: firmicutes)]
MLSLCSFAQQGAVAALKGSQEPVNQMVAEFARRREVILQGLETAPGLSCVAPGGAFYVFVKHDTRLNSFELVEYLLAEAGVATVPGPEFGTGGEGYFRLSFATSLAKCQSGVARIAKAMEKLTRSS